MLEGLPVMLEALTLTPALQKKRKEILKKHASSDLPSSH
jgi:hypothetical protein